jgi:hypothetical protein
MALLMNNIQTTLAYLDAGTGSMIAQILVGGFAAAVVAMKMYWKRIKALFGRGDDEDLSDEDLSDEDLGSAGP